MGIFMWVWRKNNYLVLVQKIIHQHVPCNQTKDAVKIVDAIKDWGILESSSSEKQSLFSWYFDQIFLLNEINITHSSTYTPIFISVSSHFFRLCLLLKLSSEFWTKVKAKGSRTITAESSWNYKNSWILTSVVFSAIHLIFTFCLRSQ